MLSGDVRLDGATCTATARASGDSVTFVCPDLGLTWDRWGLNRRQPLISWNAVVTQDGQLLLQPVGRD